MPVINLLLPLDKFRLSYYNPLPSPNILPPPLRIVTPKYYGTCESCFMVIMNIISLYTSPSHFLATVLMTHGVYLVKFTSDTSAKKNISSYSTMRHYAMHFNLFSLNTRPSSTNKNSFIDTVLWVIWDKYIFFRFWPALNCFITRENWLWKKSFCARSPPKIY